MRDRSDLRPGQLQMIELFKDYLAGIAVLGCGGGKTVSSMTAILDLMGDDEIDFAIVLAPPLVVSTAWPAEPYRWRHLHGLNLVTLTGTPMQRGKKLTTAEGKAIFTCSIDNLVWLLDRLAEMNWPYDRTMLVIDEITKLKSPNSKRRKRLQVDVERFNGVWGLTGTPRPNGYEDLFGPIKLVGGQGVWGVRDFDTWRETYFVKQDYHGFVYQPNEMLVDRLDKVARKWMFVLPDGDLDTPEVLEGEAFDRWVELSDEQRAAYEDMVEEMMVDLEAEHGDLSNLSAGAFEELVVEAMSKGVASGKLTQIVQGFMYAGEGDDRRAFHFRANPKMDTLRELLDDIGGDNVAIAYHYQEELDDLRRVLGKNTPALGSETTSKQAADIVDRWARGEIDRLLVHPASMGHGVDGLQFGGHHLIWYHPSWSAEMMHQTIKRFQRPGQKHPVRNWRILARETNDEIKDARVHNKLIEAAHFLSKLPRPG